MGQSRTFIATVSPGSRGTGPTPTGLVDFYDGDRLLGSAYLGDAPSEPLNMATLMIFGPLLERRIGSLRFAVLYLLAAATGYLTSVLTLSKLSVRNLCWSF